MKKIIVKRGERIVIKDNDLDAIDEIHVQKAGILVIESQYRAVQLRAEKIKILGTIQFVYVRNNNN